MTYTDKQIDDFNDQFNDVYNSLNELMLKTVAAGQRQGDARIREHLLHGVGRRISVIKKSTENVFSKFPVDTKKPLSRDVLYDVQINMHAYVINLYGIFDNWAWAFVLRHGLLEKIGGKHSVGLFRKGTLN